MSNGLPAKKKKETEILIGFVSKKCVDILIDIKRTFNAMRREALFHFLIRNQKKQPFMAS